MPLFHQSVELNVSATTAFQWHARPGALKRLLPHWEDVRVESATGGIQNGGRVTMSVPLGPLRKRWVAEHRDYVEGVQFTDEQLQGPFAHWVHHHRFEPLTETSCLLHDEIDYRLPLGGVGQYFGANFAKEKLAGMFAFRHQRTKSDLEWHVRYQDRPRLKILISGSTGLIGSQLVPFLTTGGHEVYRLVRDSKQADKQLRTIFWDINHGELHRSQLEGFDAVIHLAGAGIAEHRWSKEYKQAIKDSRVKSTALLSHLFATLQHKPKVFLSTSAIGFYGNRGDEILTEQSGTGLGFLPEVAREWEAAARPAAQSGIRVVHPRLGIVLSAQGGALKQMQTPFQIGFGGRVGNGQQWWSSISIDDVIYGLYFCLMEPSLQGPVNFVMPNPATNAQFTRAIGHVMRRPTVLPLPGFLVKTMLGEMGKTLLLDSTRVMPEKLMEAGYPFLHPNLVSTLKFQLGRFSRM